MTNGEKIKEVFPNLECEVKYHTVLTNIDNGAWFSLEWWNAEYKEPSSSEIPNKSIEEKCPCYHCEHFEIKGWSHCKIHEDAYGDSRCNDYHKVNQDLTKVKQYSNKSEIPTSSIAQERYQDLIDYFGNEKMAKTILEDRKEFKAWLERVKWHVKRADELARELEQLKSTTKNDSRVEKIEVRKPCINYEDGCEEWAGCPCVYYKGRK